MNEERKIEVEEVEGVTPPPKARVSDAADGPSAAETFARKRDYLEGFLSQKPAEASDAEQGGGAMIDRVTFEKTSYAPPPARFEAGTPHVVGVIGLHAAIDYVDTIGLDAIAAHEAALVRETRGALAGLNSVRLFGPEDSAGIVSFAIEGVHPHDIGTILDEDRVAIRAGHHCAQPLMAYLGVDATARASFGVYNGRQDVAALLRGIERVKRVFE